MASSPIQMYNSKNDHQNDYYKCKNIDFKECARNSVNNSNSRINTGTPKRRLSYNGNSSSTNSTPINNNNNTSNGSTPYALKNSCNLILTNDKSPQTTMNNENSNSNQNDSHNSTTPFIKRKCLSKDQNSVKFNNSPYMLSTSNLANLGDLSPKHLNDSFETLQLANNQDTITRLPSRTGSSRYLSRRASYNSSLFSKHKSAPLASFNLNQQFCNTNDPKPDSLLLNCSKLNNQDGHQPLNDISNQFNSKMSNNCVSAQLNKNLRISDDALFSDEQKDDVADLENLIFGSGSNFYSNSNTINNQQQIIKQSLEVDESCRNLIGDRSKQHILPVITSNKHQDLYCISPETLVDVLDKRYDDQIDEYIIIDSRYPYEFEGGHIRYALNVYTKEILYEEMFVKRFNCKTSRMHKFPTSVSSACLTTQSHINGNNHSVSSVSISSLEKSETELYSKPIELETSDSTCKKIENKRVIIIFHCEFSSERGPALLRFLRNQDRSLNEHNYPNLCYPELYLLEGGYKSFYENFKFYCDPQTYKPMLHEEHLSDLKHFRAKAKSWEVSRHSHFIKSSDSLHRKQVLLNQMAKASCVNNKD